VRHSLSAVLGLAGLAVLSLSAQAQQGQGAAPTVVELFTSQSCYSCPPAEAYLGELAERDDIIALEHHVDYWDELVYGSAGRWKDIFSSPEATHRQQRYNQAVEGRGYSYTPQMIVDGRIEAVGNRKREVGRAISKAREDGARLSVAVSTRPAGGLSIAIDGPVAERARVWLVHYQNEQQTRPTGGENKGKDLVNHNIVRDIRQVGEWSGANVVVDVADYRLEDGFSCVVLVQSGRPGPILGAGRCPSPTS